MHLTQGTFSYLPPLSDDQINAQVQYALDNEWALSVEFTDDPHPRNFLWDMWGLPMFDLRDPAAILLEVRTLPRGVSQPVHSSQRVRPQARTADDGAQLHRAAPQA